ncbi:glycosyltransferase family 2 protein [Vibrio coralliirubri]|uniref:glycosyltransferase family 2 protein n=1 Tax=Vibrio coralliirubri TaxID=1516159 RepID=UPI00073F191C|nr:glycosyltransferase family 2 protein [Vibrio coralliirubri]
MKFTYDVIVCTYNGRDYIIEQLDSILNQKYSPLSIIISDDGSEDETISIVSEYIEVHHDVDFVIVEGPGTGPSNNFISALKYVSSPYVFLADQDDVWCSNKVERYFDFVSKYEKNCPQLFFSNAKIVDENLNSLGRSHMGFLSCTPSQLVNNEVLFFNYIQGATICLNFQFISFFYDLTSKYSLDDVVIYDWWFGVLANYFGEIHYIDEELVLYRQHTNNIVGINKRKGLLKKIYQAFRTVRQIHRIRVILKSECNDSGFFKLYSLSSIRHVGILRYSSIFMLDIVLSTRNYFLK